MNHTQLRWVGIGSALLGAIVALWLVGQGTAKLPSPGREPHSGSERVGETAAGTSSPAFGEERVPVEPGGAASLRILVVDEADRPVPGARMYHCGAWASFAAADDVLAHADTGGHIEWSPGAEELDGQVLAIVARGFVPSVVDRTVPEQTVRLRRGESWTVRCIEESGRPVAGVRVAIGSATSKSTPPITAALRGEDGGEAMLPGPSNDRSMFVAVSGEDGCARFAGLPRSRYCFRVEHPSMVKLDAPNAAVSPLGGVPVPGPDLIVRLVPVCAAVVCHPGQRVVAASGMLSPEQFDPHLRTHGCSAVRDLTAANPDAWVRAWVPAGAVRAAGGTPTARFAFLLSRSGWVELDLSFHPLADVTPVTIPPPAEAVCCERRFVMRPRLPDVAGFPTPFVILRGAFEGRSFETSTRIGDTCWLPPGHFELSLLSPLVASALAAPDSIEVTPGGVTDVELARTADLVPCELRFRLPHGLALCLLSDVRIEHGSGATLRWPGWSSLDAELLPMLSPRQWVPAGHVVVRAVEPSLGRASREFDLARTDGVTELELSWRGE